MPMALPTQATPVYSRVKEGNWQSYQASDTGLGISKGLLKLRLKVTQKNLVRATAGLLLNSSSFYTHQGLSPRSLEPRAPSLLFSSPAPPPSDLLAGLHIRNCSSGHPRGSPTYVSRSHLRPSQTTLQSRLLCSTAFFTTIYI